MPFLNKTVSFFFGDKSTVSQANVGSVWKALLKKLQKCGAVHIIILQTFPLHLGSRIVLGGIIKIWKYV